MGKEGSLQPFWDPWVGIESSPFHCDGLFVQLDFQEEVLAVRSKTREVKPNTFHTAYKQSVGLRSQKNGYLYTAKKLQKINLLRFIIEGAGAYPRGLP